MRRADLPVALSQGFNPHPKMSLASSLAVGLTGRAEIIEVTLSEAVDPDAFVRRVNEAMPAGIRVTRAREVAAEAPNPAAAVSGATYEARPAPDEVGGSLRFTASQQALKSAIDLFLAAETVPVTRRTDKGEREIDLRPLVYRLAWTDGGLSMALSAGQAGTARPVDVLAALGQAPEAWRVERTGLYQLAGPGPETWVAAWDI